MGDLYINDFDDNLRRRLRVRALQEGVLLRDLVMRACSNELSTPMPVLTTENPIKEAVVALRKAVTAGKRSKTTKVDKNPEPVGAVPSSHRRA